MFVNFPFAIARKQTVGALELLVLDSFQDFVFLLLVVSLHLMEVVVPKPVEELSALGANETFLFLETDAALGVRRARRFRLRHGTGSSDVDGFRCRNRGVRRDGGGGVGRFPLSRRIFKLQLVEEIIDRRV